MFKPRNLSALELNQESHKTHLADLKREEGRSCTAYKKSKKLLMCRQTLRRPPLRLRTFYLLTRALGTP